MDISGRSFGMASLPTPNIGKVHPFRAYRDDVIRSLLLLNEAAQKISSILDLETLLDKIVNEVALAFDCSLSAILLKDEQSGDLVCAAAARGVKPSCSRYRIGKDGMVGHAAAIGRTYYAPDVRKDPYYLVCVPETLSEVDIPLKVGGELIGVFCAQQPRLNAFSREQLQILEALANHIAIAVQNARLFQRERQEKEEARTIQRALFPKSMPDVPGFVIDGDCVTAGAVGGDWYDFVPLRANRRNRPLWGLVLADVCGKGMAAALLMCSTRALLRSLLETYASPRIVLQRLNQILLKDLPAEKFVTMIFAVLDPSSRTLTFANAGHPWPIYGNGHGTEVLQTNSGLPLGVADCEYDERVVQLTDESRVLLYTDGVTDAGHCVANEYGEERLREHLLAPDVSAEQILKQVSNFCGGGPLCDDATVIVVRSEDHPQLKLQF
jgi:sigma-B regulation protein RsbU (phosphoserine phosphatase)